MPVKPACGSDVKPHITLSGAVEVDQPAVILSYTDSPLQFTVLQCIQ